MKGKIVGIKINKLSRKSEKTQSEAQSCKIFFSDIDQVEGTYSVLSSSSGGEEEGRLEFLDPSQGSRVSIIVGGKVKIDSNGIKTIIVAPPPGLVEDSIYGLTEKNGKEEEIVTLASNSTFETFEEFMNRKNYGYYGTINKKSKDEEVQKAVSLSLQEVGLLSENIIASNEEKRKNIFDGTVQLFASLYKMNREEHKPIKVLDELWTIESLSSLMSVGEAIGFRVGGIEDNIKFIKVVIGLVSRILRAGARSSTFSDDKQMKQRLLLKCVSSLASFGFYFGQRAIVDKHFTDRTVVSDFLSTVSSFVAYSGCALDAEEGLQVIVSLAKLGFPMIDFYRMGSVRDFLKKVITSAIAYIKIGQTANDIFSKRNQIFTFVNALGDIGFVYSILQKDIDKVMVQSLMGCVMEYVAKMAKCIDSDVTQNDGNSRKIGSMMSIFPGGNELMEPPLSVLFMILTKLNRLGFGGDALEEVIGGNKLEELLKTINSIFIAVVKNGGFLLDGRDPVVNYQYKEYQNMLLIALGSLTAMLAFKDKTKTGHYLIMLAPAIKIIIEEFHGQTRGRENHKIYSNLGYPRFESLGRSMFFLASVFLDTNIFGFQLKVEYVQPTVLEDMDEIVFIERYRDISEREGGAEKIARYAIEWMTDRLFQELRLECRVTYTLTGGSGIENSLRFECNFDFVFNMPISGNKWVRVFLEIDGPCHFIDSNYRERCSSTIKRDIMARAILEHYSYYPDPEIKDYLYVIVPQNVLEQCWGDLGSILNMKRSRYNIRNCVVKEKGAELFLRMLKDGINYRIISSPSPKGLVDHSSSLSPNPLGLSPNQHTLSPGSVSSNGNSPHSSNFPPSPGHSIGNASSDTIQREKSKTTPSYSSSSSISTSSNESSTFKISVPTLGSETTNSSLAPASLGDEPSIRMFSITYGRQRTDGYSKEEAQGFGLSNGDRVVLYNFYDPESEPLELPPAEDFEHDLSPYSPSSPYFGSYPNSQGRDYYGSRGEGSHHSGRGRGYRSRVSPGPNETKFK
ncbi:MAG: hypothetical protein LBU15_04250, partial [Rickettsiales bacterium]|nr:hypothetical protein [Rickettsiales bacterium]